MIKKLFLYGMPLFLFSVCKNQTPKRETAPKANPICDQRDTTLHLKFLPDTNFQDFYRLLDFLERKTDFRRYDTYNRKRTVPITKGNRIELQTLRCVDFYQKHSVYKSLDDYPVETWILEDVRSIACHLKSLKPLKGTRDYFPNFGLRQINFATEAQKDSALAMINSKGWGDPKEKWNDYFIVSGKKRIYVLEVHDATFADYDEKYGLFIKKEWIEKNEANQ